MNSKISKFLQKLIILVISLICLQCILTGVSMGTEIDDEANQNNVEDSNEGEYLRLSDTLSENSIPYRRESNAGWGQIRVNQDANGNKLSVKMEGAYYEFDNGIWAHATSNLYYDISEYSEKYPYLTLYMGINKTSNSGNGVKVWIYTSNSDNFHTSGTENWTLQNAETDADRVIKPGANAEFEKIDIRGAKYLRIQAYDNGSNANDHIVYIDPMLITENYKEEKGDFKTLEEYDEEIKNYPNKTLSDPEFELLVLQRGFVSNVGGYALNRFTKESIENKETLSWLMNDLENLRLYVLGGAPDGGNYYNSLTQLTRLYDEYSSDFNNTELLNNPTYPEMTYGDLYKKMAMSIALTHTQRVGLWMQAATNGENDSDALRRYAIFKYMYNNGKLKVADNMDMTPVFEELHVEEMRFLMNNAIDDEEILWLNEYVQNNVDKNPGNTWRYITPHPYIAYVWPNYGNEVYYDPNNRDYFNELFAVSKSDNNVGTELVDENGEKTGKIGLFDSEFVIPGGKNNSEYRIKVTRGTTEYKLYKVWMNFRNKFGTGCVCGGISKSGSNIRATHGIPATVIGQPGHAALLFYSKDAEGRGYWRIDNDVSGWTASEKGERMLLGWGNGSYARGSYQVVYMELAQAAINDYQNLVKAEELVMLAKVYKNDLSDETKKQDALVKQEELYRKALEIQPINFDAWLGLIEVYNANEAKTENNFYDLAEELAENLKYFPLPMYHATNLIKTKLTSVENSYRFTLLQTRTLTQASTLPNNTADSFTVVQPAVTRLEANFLLGKMDKTIATFSFDGVDAGKIVLSSRFDGSGVRWDYSIARNDAGEKIWKEVAFDANEEHKLQLTQEEINSITSENDIYVHIVGVGYEEENLYKIDIIEQALPSTLYANDLENRVVGVNLGTEWRYTENDTWTSYSVGSPDLTGDKTVQVRQSATGVKLTSNPSPIYTFTQDNQPDERKYIPVSHLTMHSVSTQATNNGGAAINAIDANYNTRWHSAWNGTDTQRFIIIKLDRPVALSAVEFVPAGGGNGKILDGTIYGSTDGETWEELANLKNLTYTNQANTIADAITNTKSFEIEEPKEVQYVKIVADRASNGNWFAARAFNLYQDITKNPHPTAGIGYSTTEPTNGIVVARLINPSTEITITNNDGKDTYIFTENGEFTFEFEDENGIEGSAVAKVDWIDKDIPNADIDYEVNDSKKLVILLESISEDVYLLDKNNNKINYIEVNNGKVTDISYLDSSGNVYKVVNIDENGIIKKITYKNTTGEVDSVENYVTIMENGVVSSEEYFDDEGNAVTITESEKETLRSLQQAMTNPLEYTFDDSGDYEFRMLDKASNIAYKSIKADYIEDNDTILASDITYDITKLTNKNVVATINPYIISTNGKNVDVEIVNNNESNKYTFEQNGSFTFEYKDTSDTEGWDIKSHTAKVNWIDKIAPTAEIRYSTKEPTDKVIASLVNESEQIVITNNGTSREYVFTQNGEFTFEFEDVAGNKATLKAEVNWIKDPTQPDEPDVPTPEEPIFTSEKYKIENGCILGIRPEVQEQKGTTVSEFKKNITTNQELKILDKDGKELKEEDIIKTGTIIIVGSKSQYTLIVTGDVDGDGKLTVNDLAKTKLHYIEIETLTGIGLKAADLDKDGAVTVNDIALNKLLLIGLATIK